MSVTIYSKTAVKAKNGKVYAFGRREKLNGRPVEEGGYYVFRLCENYDGKVHGGMRKTWRYVGEENMSYDDAVALMNRRCGYKAFNAKPKDDWNA